MRQKDLDRISRNIFTFRTVSEGRKYWVRAIVHFVWQSSRHTVTERRRKEKKKREREICCSCEQRKRKKKMGKEWASVSEVSTWLC